MDKVPNWLMLKHAMYTVQNTVTHVTSNVLFFEHKIFQGTISVSYIFQYGFKIEFTTRDKFTTILEIVSPNTIISSMYDDRIVGSGKLQSYNKCSIAFNEEEYFQNSCVEDNSWICLHDMLELYNLFESVKELHGELK